MTTVVLVTRLLDPSSAVRGFVTHHVRALGDEFDRVVVVTCAARGDTASLGVKVVVALGGEGQEVESVLARELAGVSGRTVVVVDDDLAGLVTTRAATRGAQVPLLWWCSQIPSDRAAALASRWADGFVVAAPPPTTPGCRVWAAGAGIDLANTFPESLPLEPRSPLRLVALGRTAPEKGLPIVLRALAIARSHGLDTRLRIVGPSTNANEMQHRRELEALVKNIALEAVVQIDGGVEPSAVPEILRQAHVLIDGGTDDDMSRSVLEAMAAGRVVLTASRRVAEILPSGPPPLHYEAHDAFQLADRIVGLDETWATGLPSIGGPLRRVVEEQHSLDRWQRQFSIAVDQVRYGGAARVTA